MSYFVAPKPPPPTQRHLTQEEIENNINGIPVSEGKLRELFNSLDVAGNGYLELEEVKRYYLNIENFGVEYSEEMVTEKIMKYHSMWDPNTCDNTNTRVTFEEFSCIALSIAQR